MPNYIRLIDKKTGEPESLQTIDEKLCKALQVPCDPDKYYMSWYDIIGYSRVKCIGKLIDIAKRAMPNDPYLPKVLGWLDSNYTLETWYSHD